MNADTLIQELGGREKPTLQERFDSKWELDPDSDCWIWKGSKRTTVGLIYGGMVIVHSHFLAHRISWILHRGELSKDMEVLHKCDVPLCVNPDHLFIGTQKDNVDDMIQKGRKAILRGELAGSSKLKEAQVVEILEQRRKGYSLGTLMKIHELPKGTVHDIITRRQWKHVSIPSDSSREILVKA